VFIVDVGVPGEGHYWPGCIFVICEWPGEIEEILSVIWGHYRLLLFSDKFGQSL